jgi:tryptophanyl-tRNA synthetase
MKAKTDAGPGGTNEEMPDSIKNLFQLIGLVSDTGVTEKFKKDFQNGEIRYGDMKKQLAEDMIRFIAPIREKANDIRRDEAFLKQIIRRGAECARESAVRTIEGARKAIGLNYL